MPTYYSWLIGHICWANFIDQRLQQTIYVFMVPFEYAMKLMILKFSIIAHSLDIIMHP